MNLQRYISSCLLVVLLAFASTMLASLQKDDTLQSKDNSSVQMIPVGEMLRSGRMHSSAFPIQMMVRGRSVSIVSEHEQTLPIYTQTGTLYMAMHLSKGTNWLSGLPRGKYFINLQLVTVN